MLRNILIGVWLIVLAIGALSVASEQVQSDPLLHISLTTVSASTIHKGGGNDTVIGQPSLSADFINHVLAQASSPAAGLGLSLYTLSQQYNIDDAYALAFFNHESSFGTTGVAQVTRSLSNMRCVSGLGCLQENGGYAIMKSWEQGFEEWYKLIKYGYVQGQVTIPLVGHSCTTTQEIVPVYAPSSDHNDVAGYIKAVNQDVARWRVGTL